MTDRMMQIAKDKVYSNRLADKSFANNKSYYIICKCKDQYYHQFLNDKKATYKNCSSDIDTVIIDGEEWRGFTWMDSRRAYRASKLYLDKRLCDTEAIEIIAAVISHYCQEVRFF